MAMGVLHAFFFMVFSSYSFRGGGEAHGLTKRSTDHS